MIIGTSKVTGGKSDRKITIIRSVAEKLGVGLGDTVAFCEQGGEIILRKASITTKEKL